MLFSFSPIFERSAAVIAPVIFFCQLLQIQPSFANSSNATDNGFKDMMQGFPECRLEGIYIAPWEDIDRPNHQFFDDLFPYKIEDDFAYYKIEADYYDLPVSEIMIPAGTWGVYAVTFDVPIEISRARLQTIFGSSFQETEASELGLVPELIIDPMNKQQSIWICTSPF